MESRTRNTIVVVVLLLIALGAGGYFFSDDLRASADERAVRALVADFGAQMKNVSLLDPNAPDTIESQYKAYATPELIDLWQSDPSKAPGRLTSSPWPERIEITSVTPQGSGYVVQGAVILKTSGDDQGGNSGITPLYLQLIRIDGDWRIVAYQEVATSTPN